MRPLSREELLLVPSSTLVVSVATDQLAYFEIYRTYCTMWHVPEAYKPFHRVACLAQESVWTRH